VRSALALYPAESSLSTASLKLLFERWLYRIVVLISLCPSNSCTVLISTPVITKREAKVCLRSWNLKSRIRARRNAAENPSYTSRLTPFCYTPFPCTQNSVKEHQGYCSNKLRAGSRSASRITLIYHDHCIFTTLITCLLSPTVASTK